MSAFLLLAASLAATPADTAPIECGACAEWNQAQAPFRLHGDSWYVGTKGLSAVLVATPKGLVLIDGGLPQSAPLIAANVQALGFELRDVRFLLNSHAHFDHAGGLAALQRLSGAPVVTTRAGAVAMRRGATTHDDPQAGFGDKANGYPPIAAIQVIEDGGSVSVGDVVFRMHASPGHTPGGTTWSWRSCESGDCRDMVYADSLTAVSAPGFRFSDDPPRVAEFRATIARVAALPCDLVVSAHPGFSGLFEKLAERETDPTHNPLLDPKACQAYAQTGEDWLARRLAEEAAAAPAD